MAFSTPFRRLRSSTLVGALPLLGWLAFAVSGCGTDSTDEPVKPTERAEIPADALNCEDIATKFAPCGGDVVGEWKVQGVCTDLSTSIADSKASCPKGKLESFATGRGTYTFTAEGQAVPQDAFFGNLVHIVAPKECNSRTCDEIAQSLPGEAEDVAVCEDTGDDCDCTLEVKETAVKDTDAYSVNGDEITLTAAAKYCASANALVIALPTSPQTLTKTFLVFGR